MATVLEALRCSRKGALSYDAQWYTDGRLKEIIDECSSPPSMDIELLGALERLQISSRENNLKNSFTEERGQTKSSGTYGLIDSEDECDDGEEEREEDEEAEEKEKIRHSPSKLDVTVRQRAAKAELERRRFDLEMQEEARKITEKRRLEQELFSRRVQEQVNRDIALKLQEREIQQKAVLQIIRDLDRESEELKERRLKQQHESHKLHLKRLDANMRAAIHKKEVEEAEKRKRREMELKTFLASLAKVKNQIDEQAKKIVENLDSCPHQTILEPASRIKNLVVQLQQKADKLAQTAALSQPSAESFQQMTYLIQMLLKLNEQSNKAIDAAEKQAQELAKLKAKEEQAKQKQEPKPQETKPPPSSSTISSTRPPLPSEDAALDKFIAKGALSEYKELIAKHEEVIKSYEELSKTKDKDLKKKLFELQKAVNTPINALSAQSGHHFLDKVKRLRDLLDGKTVTLGTKRICVDVHPAGLAYCKDLLAKKLAKQGQEQVASNFESAFIFASLAIGLWCHYPDLGQLILAHFHHHCPFLVPYHIPKEEGMSNEDYYKLLGYTVDSEGNVEKQDKYLQRMTGFTRLYAAMLISDPPPGCGQMNPFGLDKAWQWLTRILNLQPQPDITATMLFDFLEVCGHAMSRAYGNQFFKLIQVLVHLYFPKIEEVTPKGSGGPVMRLKTYLQDCLKSRRFPQPPGVLTASFWRS